MKRTEGNECVWNTFSVRMNTFHRLRRNGDDDDDGKQAAGFENGQIRYTGLSLNLDFFVQFFVLSPSIEREREMRERTWEREKVFKNCDEMDFCIQVSTPLPDDPRPLAHSLHRSPSLKKRSFILIMNLVLITSFYSHWIQLYQLVKKLEGKRKRKKWGREVERKEIERRLVRENIFSLFQMLSLSGSEHWNPRTSLSTLSLSLSRFLSLRVYFSLKVFRAFSSLPKGMKWHSLFYSILLPGRKDFMIYILNQWFFQPINGREWKRKVWWILTQKIHIVYPTRGAVIRRCFKK